MEGTIGEIRMFGGNFAPRNWSFCSGQLLAISLNTALFSILGTTYGGNGTTNFLLPDLRGRMPVGEGQGPGLSDFNLGQVSGVENVTILGNNLPQHNHIVGGTIKMQTSTTAADTPSPANHYFANDGSTKYNPSNSGGIMKPLNLNGISASGSGTPVSNLVPYLALNYIICISGLFPSRN